MYDSCRAGWSSTLLVDHFTGSREWTRIPRWSDYQRHRRCPRILCRTSRAMALVRGKIGEAGVINVREPANRGTSGATVGRTGRWRNAVCKRSDSRPSALTGQNIAFRGRLPSAWNRRKSPNVGHRLVVPRIARSAGIAHKAYAHVRFSFLNPWT